MYSRDRASRTDQYHEDEGTDPAEPPDLPPSPAQAQSERDEVEDDDELSSVYDFIEVCAAGSSRLTPPLAGPSSARTVPLLLDDDDDAQEEEEDKTAGEVLYTDEDVRRKWLEGRGMGTQGSEGT